MRQLAVLIAVIAGSVFAGDVEDAFVRKLQVSLAAGPTPELSALFYFEGTPKSIQDKLCGEMVDAIGKDPEMDAIREVEEISVSVIPKETDYSKDQREIEGLTYFHNAEAAGVLFLDFADAEGQLPSITVPLCMVKNPGSQ